MTEATTPREAAADTLAISADTMAHDFVAALLQELRSMPDHWARLNAERQQAIIERLKEKVRASTEKAINIIIRNEFPAVQADLEQVSWKGGLQISAKVARDAIFRHQLSDAQGQKVLIVIAPADRWFNRMDEIKARGDQIDMWDSDDVSHVSGVDQPHYRRDQERVAPAGPTWADLKKQLNIGGEPGDKPKPEEPASEATPAEGEAPAPADDQAPLLFGSSLNEQQEAQAQAVGIQEQLAAIGVAVSLGTVQAWTLDEIRVVKDWASVYAADPGNCPIARPHWLPIPEPKAGDEQ